MQYGMCVSQNPAVTTTNPKIYIGSNLIEVKFSHACTIKASSPDVKKIPHKVSQDPSILNLHHHQCVARSSSFLASGWKKEKRTYKRFSCTSPWSSWSHFHLPVTPWLGHSYLQGTLGSLFYLFTQKGKRLSSRIHSVSVIVYEFCCCCRIRLNEKETVPSQRTIYFIIKNF